MSHDPEQAPFRDGLTSAGCDLLPLTYRPNLKFLTTLITKIWEAVQNVQIGVVWGTWGSLKVIGNVTIRYSAYDFLFDFNRNHASQDHQQHVVVILKDNSHRPPLYWLQRFGLCCGETGVPRRTRVLEHRPYYCRVETHHVVSCLRKCSRDAAFEVIASTCSPHLRLLATLTPSSLKDVTWSTGMPLKVTDGGWSLATVPIMIIYSTALEWVQRRKLYYSFFIFIFISALTK